MAVTGVPNVVATLNGRISGKAAVNQAHRPFIVDTAAKRPGAVVGKRRTLDLGNIVVINCPTVAQTGTVAIEGAVGHNNLAAQVANRAASTQG